MYEYVYPPNGVKERYLKERGNRKISPLLVMRLLNCSDKFVADNSVDEYYFAGSVASLSVWDEQTKIEEPKYWLRKWEYLSWKGRIRWKYSDIDLVIPNRPDLIGIHTGYKYVIDVNDFKDQLITRGELLKYA